MMSGTILFLAGQADRLLVGKIFGLTELGRFSAILLLILYPTAVIQRLIHGLFLPVIARASHHVPNDGAASDQLAGLSLFLAVATAAGFVIVAPPMAVIFYGNKFAHSWSVFALIGILQTSRFIRIWPATIALALGNSRIELMSNIIRLIGYPAAILASKFLGLEGLISGLIVGEIIALLASILMTNRARNLGMTSDLMRFVIFVAFSGALVGGIIGWQLGFHSFGNPDELGH